MNEHTHWESVFQRKANRELSWYRPHLERSVELLKTSGLDRSAPVIDVGGGSSTFVDDVLDLGYSDVTVLDISETALEKSRLRLGDRASSVEWIAADITATELAKNRYEFWHDRAVFHFLVDESARHRYIETVRRALRPGGRIVVATFGSAGPEKCSGLEVVRYSGETLHAEFGGTFEKLAAFEDTHMTPWGAEQEFVYCYCRMSVRPATHPVDTRIL